MCPSMPPNSTRSGVSGTLHGFSGRVGTWSVNLRDSPSNCAVRQHGLNDATHLVNTRR
jgi:hypothetical protein